MFCCSQIQHSHLHSLGHVTGRSLWSYVSELEFRAVFFICSVIVLAAIVLYCRRLQRMSKRPSPLTFTTYTSGCAYSSKQPVKAAQPDTFHQVMPVRNRVLLEDYLVSSKTWIFTPQLFDRIYINSSWPVTCKGKGSCNSSGNCICNTNYYGSDCSSMYLLIFLYWTSHMTDFYFLF